MSKKDTLHGFISIIIIIVVILLVFRVITFADLWQGAINIVKWLHSILSSDKKLPGSDFNGQNTLRLFK